MAHALRARVHFIDELDMDFTFFLFICKRIKIIERDAFKSRVVFFSPFNYREKGWIKCWPNDDLSCMRLILRTFSSSWSNVLFGDFWSIKMATSTLNPYKWADFDDIERVFSLSLDISLHCAKQLPSISNVPVQIRIVFTAINHLSFIRKKTAVIETSDKNPFDVQFNTGFLCIHFQCFLP